MNDSTAFVAMYLQVAWVVGLALSLSVLILKDLRGLVGVVVAGIMGVLYFGAPYLAPYPRLLGVILFLFMPVWDVWMIMVLATLLRRRARGKTSHPSSS